MVHITQNQWSKVLIHYRVCVCVWKHQMFWLKCFLYITVSESFYFVTLILYYIIICHLFKLSGETVCFTAFTRIFVSVQHAFEATKYVVLTSSDYKSDTRQCVTWILIPSFELIWSLSFLLLFICHFLRLFHQSLTAILIVFCELLHFCNDQFTLQLIRINQLYVVRSASNSERRAPSFTHVWYSAWIFCMKGFCLCFSPCGRGSMRLTYWTSIAWDCTIWLTFYIFPDFFGPGLGWKKLTSSTSNHNQPNLDLVRAAGLCFLQQTYQTTPHSWSGIWVFLYTILLYCGNKMISFNWLIKKKTYLT